jgi:hypothetical protein
VQQRLIGLLNRLVAQIIAEPGEFKALTRWLERELLWCVML